MTTNLRTNNRFQDLDGLAIGVLISQQILVMLTVNIYITVLMKVWFGKLLVLISLII